MTTTPTSWEPQGDPAPVEAWPTSPAWGNDSLTSADQRALSHQEN